MGLLLGSLQLHKTDKMVEQNIILRCYIQCDIGHIVAMENTTQMNTIKQKLKMILCCFII